MQMLQLKNKERYLSDIQQELGRCMALGKEPHPSA
jgi:hypothetical protein